MSPTTTTPPTIPLHFRTAVLADAPAIQQLIQSSFRTPDPRTNWTGDAALAAHFRLPIASVSAALVDPATVTLVAEDSSTNALVGTIQVAKRGAAGRLSMLAVNVGGQCAGVGRAVLAHAEGYCRRTWGVREFSLNALSTREALIEWYGRRGYRVTGERTGFPRGEFEGTGVVLPEGLAFVEMVKGVGEVREGEVA